MESVQFTRRTHTCGELRDQHVDERVTLNGWVQKVRDHHHFVFVDLRDRYGVTQVFFGGDDAERLREAGSLRAEDVLSITGTVRARPDDKVNEDLADRSGGGRRRAARDAASSGDPAVRDPR